MVARFGAVLESRTLIACGAEVMNAVVLVFDELLCLLLKLAI
jgi:hypothetical protein